MKYSLWTYIKAIVIQIFFWPLMIWFIYRLFLSDLIEAFCRPNC